MSKIEELAKAIAKDFIRENKESINNDAPLVHESVQYTVGRIMSLPLSDRLTAEEADLIRKEYNNTYPLDPDCGVANILIQGVLERIFGKEFFKEDKE